jgi:Fe-S cluster biogenesis protein NfuA
MSDARTLEAQQRRIDELIAALLALDDARARDIAQALLRVVLDLHASGLARLAEIVDEVEGSDGPIAVRLAEDRQVSAMLLLHGLHPLDLPSRVRRAVDGLRAALGAQGLRIELVDAGEDAVCVRLAGTPSNGKIEPAALQRDIERAILEQAPEVAKIEVKGLPEANVHELRFMPVLHSS